MLLSLFPAVMTSQVLADTERTYAPTLARLEFFTRTQKPSAF
jgi:hypothetical protein